MSDLRFLGDWKLWAGLPVALLLAAAAWFLYRRETRERADRLSWLLPALRSGAVFFIVMMLTGPVLHHRTIVGELARVLLFVDASESMGVTDEQMEMPRKLLIAQRLGWLPPDKFDLEIKKAGDRITSAEQLAAGARDDMKPAELKEIVRKVLAELEAIPDQLGRVKADAWPNVALQSAKLKQDLVVPARKIAAEDDPEKIVRELVALGNQMTRWEKEIQKAFSDHVFRTFSKDESVKSVLKRFDTMPRWQRLEAMLMSGENSMLAEMAAKHNVELSALVGSKRDVIWWPGNTKLDQTTRMPQQLGASPTNHTTDLSDAIRTRIEEIKDAERTAVVVFTDGQHNDGSSPLETAKMLGHRGIPIFTVGLGMQQPPQDLAILEVKGPDAVFADARVLGEIVLKDDMRPGITFALRIENEGETLWEKNFITEQKHQRSVFYDFSVKELVQRQVRQRSGELNYSSVPLHLKVSATVLDGEKDAKNNVGALRVSAVTQKPKMLLLDGRPRWEHRYLRNLFERDQRWDVNALLAGGGGEAKPWPRGKKDGQFPATREDLYAYQVICFGDVPHQQLKTEELEWIRDFVQKRGGGLLFIDGRQEQLASYANTPLGELLPVTWRGAPLGESPLQLKLVATGSALSPMTLLSEPVENAQLWASLKAPHWAAPATALTGSETLLAAVAGRREVPLMVFRRDGAGRVLYFGSDESWRWRYNAGDLYHQKFWNQMAKWILEDPFTVADKFVSLDSGALTYRPNDIAEVRVRVRDAQGRLMPKANAEAVIYRDGRKVATVPLAADDSTTAIFRGKTPPLTEGKYEVRVQVEGLPEAEMKARTEFAVELQGSGELAQLNCDEDLLREVAFHSGGQYYREEEVSALLDRLKPLSQGKVIESETSLWQSWWWFAPIVLFLAVEWFLRKRMGML